MNYMMYDSYNMGNQRKLEKPPPKSQEGCDNVG